MITLNTSNVPFSGQDLYSKVVDVLVALDCAAKNNINLVRVNGGISFRVLEAMLEPTKDAVVARLTHAHQDVRYVEIRLEVLEHVMMLYWPVGDSTVVMGYIKAPRLGFFLTTGELPTDRQRTDAVETFGISTLKTITIEYKGIHPLATLLSEVGHMVHDHPHIEEFNFFTGPGFDFSEVAKTAIFGLGLLSGIVEDEGLTVPVRRVRFMSPDHDLGCTQLDWICVTDVQAGLKGK